MERKDMRYRSTGERVFEEEKVLTDEDRARIRREALENSPYGQREKFWAEIEKRAEDRVKDLEEAPKREYVAAIKGWEVRHGDLAAYPAIKHRVAAEVEKRASESGKFQRPVDWNAELDEISAKVRQEANLPAKPTEREEALSEMRKSRGQG